MRPLQRRPSNRFHEDDGVTDSETNFDGAVQAIQIFYFDIVSADYHQRVDMFRLATRTITCRDCNRGDPLLGFRGSNWGGAHHDTEPRPSFLGQSQPQPKIVHSVEPNLSYVNSWREYFAQRGFGQTVF